jgi:hypothetical protein
VSSEPLQVVVVTFSRGFKSHPLRHYIHDDKIRKHDLTS